MAFIKPMHHNKSNITIYWTNAELISWHIYAALAEDELTLSNWYQE